MTDTIGFIGLGTMGGPMAQRLVEAGYSVTGFDLDATKLGEAAAVGVTTADSAVECARQADVLLTSLPRPDHVERLMLEDGIVDYLGAGSLWVDLTTNSIELLHRIRERARAEADIVDAPVTGAVDGARQGTLTLFLGGESEPLDRAESILGHLGRTIRCGQLGHGNVVKLVTNQLWFIHAAALGEGFAVGTANGVSLDVLWESIKASVGDSFVARHDAPSIFAGHYDPSFTLDLCVKDLGLIATLSDNVDTTLPLTETAKACFETASDRYGSDVGELHVAKRIEDDADLSFRLKGDWVPHWEA